MVQPPSQTSLDKSSSLNVTASFQKKKEAMKSELIEIKQKVIASSSFNRVIKLTTENSEEDARLMLNIMKQITESQKPNKQTSDASSSFKSQHSLEGVKANLDLRRNPMSEEKKTDAFGIEIENDFKEVEVEHMTMDELPRVEDNEEALLKRLTSELLSSSSFFKTNVP